MLLFNKAFKGKGQKMKSYFETHYQQQGKSGVISKAEVVSVLANNKKQLNFQILQEFNRLQK